LQIGGFNSKKYDKDQVFIDIKDKGACIMWLINSLMLPEQYYEK